MIQQFFEYLYSDLFSSSSKIPNPNIDRRTAIRWSATLGSALVTNPGSLIASPTKENFKLLIRNAKVFYRGAIVPKYIAIGQDNRIKVSNVPLPADAELDGSGKILSPGFIDVLADNAGNPQRSYQIFEKYKLADGLTTVLQLHGGAASPQTFHQSFDSRPHYTNYGVGVFVMLIRYQHTQVATRVKLVEKALDEGGLAVCHSLEYQPTPYSEVLEYAKLAARYNRPLFLHLRYSSEADELEGVKEAIRLAQEAGARIHIDHLHSTGGTYQMAKALELIQSANNFGTEITTCVYPYSYWATYLASTRFNEGWKERYKISYEDLKVVGSGETLNPNTFRLYRNRPGLLVAVPPGTMPMEQTVDLALQTDFCLIASDGGIESEPRANNHPRGAGCFATAIRHGLDIGMSLEKILAKITTLPAKLMRGCMQDRGAIEDGYIADLTLFDPHKIKGLASVANPNQFSDGIEAVILNGEIVYRPQKLLATRGNPIRCSS